MQTFTASVEGDFGKEAWPTEEVLELKVGARVIMLNNDSLGRWVNGTIAQIEAAIQGGHDLEIVYLKASDEKSRRRVTPIDVGEMEYKNKPFLGMTAHCHKQDDERVFRVDRILEMREVEIQTRLTQCALTPSPRTRG